MGGRASATDKALIFRSNFSGGGRKTVFSVSICNCVLSINPAKRTEFFVKRTVLQKLPKKTGSGIFDIRNSFRTDARK